MENKTKVQSKTTINKVVEIKENKSGEISNMKNNDVNNSNEMTKEPAVDEIKKYGIYIDRYTKKFKKFLAVDDITFKVNHGLIHGFIGPNGAGKTTTIKALIGAFRQSSGNIYIEGFKAGTVKAKRVIGYIPERASFPGHLTCMEYLVTMGSLSGFSARESKKRAITILEELELMKHQHRKPVEFSSGMKKKILIAQALMLDPTVMILDEPAANLDPSARKELFDKIKEFKKQNKTVLISSHILSELQDIVDEVTFIVQGKIRFSGNMKELSTQSGAIIKFDNPNSPKTIKFIKKWNINELNSNHKYDAKSESDFFELLANLAKEKIAIQSVSSLKSNLNYFYENLVGIHGNESGVNNDAPKNNKGEK